MIAKTITYEDFDGLERTETFYFNLTQTELTEMNFTKQGGYAEYLKAIADAKDAPSLAKIFKELILKSVGEKSEDGRHFYKSDKIREDFECSAVYDIIYSELISSEDNAVNFFIGVLPKSLQEKVYEEMNKNKATK